MDTYIETKSIEEYKEALHALQTLAFSNVKSVDKSLVEELMQKLQEEINNIYVI